MKADELLREAFSSLKKRGISQFFFGFL